ncbi:hypothetical protein ACFWIW_10835 [Amycolatopsis sp. NPDC058340]|uniref:hypothetical protein n=1 Tax=Amycolatopsis sp. NPDC058340 TaxID=3346453 RepID=UPI00365C14B6
MKPTAKIKLGSHGNGSVVVDDLDIANTITRLTVHTEAGGGTEAQAEVRFLVAESEFEAAVRVDDRTRTALLKLGWAPPGETAPPASTPRPEHLGLADLIARLEREHETHPDKRIRTGFHRPQSYRGDYMDLAFEITHDVPVKDMLDSARLALGTTFQGWKGGDYTMHEHTQVWLIPEPGDCGESLGAILLEHLLAQEVTA